MQSQEILLTLPQHIYVQEIGIQNLTTFFTSMAIHLFQTISISYLDDNKTYQHVSSNSFQHSTQILFKAYTILFLCPENCHDAPSHSGQKPARPSVPCSLPTSLTSSTHYSSHLIYSLTYSSHVSFVAGSKTPEMLPTLDFCSWYSHYLRIILTWVSVWLTNSSPTNPCSEPTFSMRFILTTYGM